MRTYLDDDVQESFAFTGFGAGSTDHDPSMPGRVSFQTAAPYEAVELEFSRTGGTGSVSARIHAFCSN